MKRRVEIKEIIERELLNWPGVTAGQYRFGGREFRVGNLELGHLHGSAVADLPFSRAIRDELVSIGKVAPHHHVPNSGGQLLFSSGGRYSRRACALSPQLRTDSAREADKHISQGCHLKPNMKATSKPTQKSQNAMAASRRSKSSSKRVSPDVVKLAAPDLTQRPPRSPRSRLGGYSILPRALDKARATLADTNGEYHFNCPVDQHFFRFVGIDAKKLLAELKKGKGDGEILQWIQANAKHKRLPWEIDQWSNYMDRRGPDSDAETMEFFARYVAKLTRTREDIKTWADVLELDDFVSFGGKS